MDKILKKGIEAEITSFGVRVTINRKLCPDNIYIKNRLFLWSQEGDKLIITDDAYDLERLKAFSVGLICWLDFNGENNES